MARSRLVFRAVAAAAFATALLPACKARAPVAELESAYGPLEIDAMLVPEQQLVDGGTQALMIPATPSGAAGDLRAYDTPARDQSRRATGAAFAVAATLENLLRQQGQTVDLSEEQLITQSGAASVRLSADVATRTGVVAESDWPYASAASRTDRPIGRALGVQALDFNGVVRSLTVDRRPVIMAIVANSSWAANNRGMIDPFAADTAAFGRAHAVEVSAIGYDRDAPGGGYFLFKNSWGSSWGDNGFGSLPFSYCQTRHCYAWALTGAAVAANMGAAAGQTVASMPNCDADIAVIARGGSGICYTLTQNVMTCFQYAANTIYATTPVVCSGVSGTTVAGFTGPSAVGGGRAAPSVNGPGAPAAPGTVPGQYPQGVQYPQYQPQTFAPGTLTTCGCLADGAQCYLTRGAQHIPVGPPAPNCAQTCTDRAAMNSCRY